MTSHALDPLLCHKLSHLLGPLPLERDVLYERPLGLDRIRTVWRRRFGATVWRRTVRRSAVSAQDVLAQPQENNATNINSGRRESVYDHLCQLKNEV